MTTPQTWTSTSSRNNAVTSRELSSTPTSRPEVEPASTENISTRPTYVAIATDASLGQPSTEVLPTEGLESSTGNAAEEISTDTSSGWTTAEPLEGFLLDFKILEGHNWTDGLMDNTTEEYRNLTSVLRNALWEMYGNSSLADDIDDIIIDGFTEGCVEVHGRLFLAANTATAAELTQLFRRAVITRSPALASYTIRLDSIQVFAANITSIPSMRTASNQWNGVTSSTIEATQADNMSAACQVCTVPI
ncbi:uncharacterized protein LOC144879039 [Branchiostoma floridae x Branchiostoma japonicum]